MAKTDTKNPFNKGVSYADFLSNVTDKVSLKSLLDKLNLDSDSREWIESELKQYKQTNK